ncbi:hypothetical protein CWO90_43985 [Bradyrhizobium sp. Leo121]|nr:hypothetical protein CWO90_43985 [Bradyrhizobium sp. Leo121]
MATVTVTIISGAFMYFAGRPKARADVQAMLNDGFNKLITDLQDERNQLREIIKQQGEHITLLEGDVRNLQQANDSLKHFIEAHGLTPPRGRIRSSY